MFVRFRQTKTRLQASLIETRRLDGKVRHEHIASLGSVDVPPSVEGRIAFWRRLHERLGKLSNRLDAAAQAKIMGDIHARIPMVTADEQRALQLENAKGDLRFWDGMADMHADLAAGHKGLIAAAERTIAKSEDDRAKAAERAEQAKQRIARIENGEEVSGGLGKPMTQEDMRAMMLAAGMTDQDIRRCQEVHEIYEAGGEELLLREIGNAQDRAQDRTIRDVLRLVRLPEDVLERIMNADTKETP